MVFRRAALGVVGAALALGIWSRPLPAAPPAAFGFRTYGSDQGLASLQVTAMAQDQEGYLWVGTENGLFRFDGQRFRRMGAEDGLAVAPVLSLQAPQDGGVWVLTTKGVSHWDGRQFLPLVPMRDMAAESLSLAVGPGGNALLWAGGSVFECRELKGFSPVTGFPGKTVEASCLGRSGEPYALQEGVLWRRSRKGWESRDLSRSLQGRALAMIEDSRGRLWVRTRTSIYRLQGFGGAVQDVAKGRWKGLSDRSSLVEDRLGRIWTPVDRGLLCLQDQGSWVLDDQAGLPEKRLGVVFVDREGSLWAGGSGLHRLQGRFLWSFCTQRQGLPGTMVWAGCHTRDGLEWVATNRGVAVGDSRGWRPFPGTWNRRFFTFHEDPLGNLWMGGEGGFSSAQALAFRRAGSQTLTWVPLASAHSANISVTAIQHLADGDLLVGTLEDGLHRLRREGEGWRSSRVVLPGVQSAAQINGLGRHRDVIWVATQDGLVIGNGLTWTRLGVQDGLKDDAVNCAALSPTGELWISYLNAQGLSRIRCSEGKWGVAGHVTAPDPLVRDMVLSALFDSHGVLWLGTTQGVKRWDGSRLECFGQDDGLPRDEASGSAAWLDAEGHVWFGTAGGVARFDAKSYLPPPSLPPVKILNLWDGSGKLMDLEAPEQIVDYATRNITIRFTALGYASGPRQGFQVRLSGLDTRWEDTDLPEIRYSGLPPGRYVFEVRTRDINGLVGPVTSLKIQILSTFGWWVRIAAGTAVLGFLLYLLWRWAHNQQKRKTEQAEKDRQLREVGAALEAARRVDALTGLPTRHSLDLLLPGEAALALRQYRGAQMRPGEPMPEREDLAFIMLELDGFDAILERHGGDTGDALLQQVVHLLGAVCRDSDLLIRLEGSRFLLVAKRISRTNAPAISEKLLLAFRCLSFLRPDGGFLELTCAIGFCPFPVLPGMPQALDWREAMRGAEQCLVAARASGGNGWVGIQGFARDGGEIIAARLAEDLSGLVGEGMVDVGSSFGSGALIWDEPLD